MKGKAFFVVLLAGIVAALWGLFSFSAVLADGGFTFGEIHPCQVCTENETQDLNQYELHGQTVGQYVPYDYWSPIPGERGNVIYLCGYRSGASGADIAYLIPIYYLAAGPNYRTHLDGWEVPGDGGKWNGIPFPLTFGNGWEVKAKWYSEPVVNSNPCDAGVDFQNNICYYLNGSQATCDDITDTPDAQGYYHCVNYVQGWVFGDTVRTVTGKAANDVCTPHPPRGNTGWLQTPDEASIPPCTQITVAQENDGSVTLGCTLHYYNVSVKLSFCAAVERKPFPRAITGQPVFFKVDPAQDFQASSNPINFCTPDVQNYVLTLEARPDTGTKPMWRFNDRPNVAEQTAQGWTVQHTFQTSSWGLELMGPSLDGRQWLPAYKVEALVPYAIYVRRTWNDFHGGSHVVEAPLDLRDYGYPTKDLWVPAYDATKPPPGVPDMHWPQCIVPVPVIEAQGVITGP